MLFRQLFDQETWTYTYLLADAATGEAVLIDPVLEQVDRDMRLLTELGLTLKYCLETHIHADHITGTGKLRELTGCTSIVPQNANAACADRYLAHGETVTIGAIEIRGIATPGHTDSHMAFLAKGNYLFTGDSLFVRGCGRTDFQSGDAGLMYDCVTQELFTLPDDTLVYPGHDYRGHMMSTICEEKRFNPRFVGKNREQFIELMDNLNLPNPKKIMQAVPANERCGKLDSTTAVNTAVIQEANRA